MPCDNFVCTSLVKCIGYRCVYRKDDGSFEKCPYLHISNIVDDEMRGG